MKDPLDAVFGKQVYAGSRVTVWRSNDGRYVFRRSKPDEVELTYTQGQLEQLARDAALPMDTRAVLLELANT